MSKIAIVFWSGTGNTEVMSTFVANGVNEEGAEAAIFLASEFNPDTLDDYDAIAFGCPSMGSEELEETCESLGAVLVSDSVICNETPDEDEKNSCIALGKALTN